MRVLLLLPFLLAAAPSAQTVVFVDAADPVAESFRLPDDFAAEDPVGLGVHASPDPGAGVLVAVTSLPVAVVGALSGTILLKLAEPCLNCGDSYFGSAAYASAAMVGGAVGTMYVVWGMSDLSGRRSSALATGDVKATLIGVGVGSLVGGVTTFVLTGLVDDSDFAGWIVTGVLQAVGAGIAVGMR